jgi:hypothetical protein
MSDVLFDWITKRSPIDVKLDCADFIAGDNLACLRHARV